MSTNRISPYIYPGLKISPETPTLIAEVVCMKLGVDISKLATTRGNRALIKARHICYYLIRERLGLTYEAIGEFMGRDHSAVITCGKKIAGYISVYPEYRELIAELNILINLAKRNN